MLISAANCTTSWRPRHTRQKPRGVKYPLHPERGGSEDKVCEQAKRIFHCIETADPLFPMAAPHGGAPPAPVAVLSQQFCAPYVVPMTVTKKALSLSDGDFTVTDANGGVVLRVKGAIFSVRHRRVLVDAAGQPILTMAKKVPNTLWIGCPFLQIFLSAVDRNLACLVSFARARSDMERWIGSF
jgi:hypothetical protein